MHFYSQINDDSTPLIECRDLEKFNLEDGYSIVPQVHPSWKGASRRLLVVVETVDSLDLKHQSLLSGLTVDPGSYGDEQSDHNPMRSVLSNILDLASNLLKPYGITPNDDYAFGIANFNAKKIRHLESREQTHAFPAFTQRLLSIIEKLKPTHVLVCGDTPAHYLLEALEVPEKTPKRLQPAGAAENSQYKRGWVFKRVLKGHQFLMTPTLDLEGLYRLNKGTFDEDEDDNSDGGDKYAAADLLYFVTRNIANLFNGKMLHDLSWVKPNAIYVDTIEKFDEFYEKLIVAPKIATDLETKSLSSLNNRIYMAQFALSAQEAYVIPVKHPHESAPFSEEESEYIYKKLRKFLLSKKSKILVFLNGTFDTRVFRTQFDMELIPYHRIWEVTAGEQLLDENLGLFSRFKMHYAGAYIKTSYQNLRALCCLYGNDWYWRAKFSKEERHLVGTYPPDDPDCLAYCLPRGQTVLTPDGRKNIEDVKKGDVVTSYNSDTYSLENKVVINTLKHDRKGGRRLIKLNHGSGSVVVTDDHPVWSATQGRYIEAGSIKPGEQILVAS